MTGEMTIEQLRGWMRLVNTMTLELILLEGDANRPDWYTQEMTQEVQRRKERKG
jgi:hypothetical protein